MKTSKTLRDSYKKYKKIVKTKKTVLDFFRAFMPEMVFRTTKLEGEPVTRRMVKSIF